MFDTSGSAASTTRARNEMRSGSHARHSVLSGPRDLDAMGRGFSRLPRIPICFYNRKLFQNRNRSSFTVVLYSKQADALAQASTVEAVRLETQQARQREIEKQKKHDDDERLELEKARSNEQAELSALDCL